MYAELSFAQCLPSPSLGQVQHDGRCFIRVRSLQAFKSAKRVSTIKQSCNNNHVHRFIRPVNYRARLSVASALVCVDLSVLELALTPTRIEHCQ